MSEESWVVKARRGGYRASPAARHTFPMDYAVHGLMPATGATVWFGTGSTGKTQLLLWLAAHIAAQGEHAPSLWLGQELKVKGQILVLTAEDLQEHVFQRIGSIARKMVDLNGGTEADVAAICDRIHVMAFLSMGQDEFTEPNPCLFERGHDGRWKPTKSLNDIESFLEDWNEHAKGEDRIVGVIMDSAVSMAGFEMTYSEATTNFLFHVNRMSRRQKMFWAIIGHTQKDAGRKSDDAAVERLRGSAMWSTTPRTVIEVRVAGAGDNTAEVEAAYPGVAVRDIVYVQVVKANSQKADLRPRALRRIHDGGFADLTPDFPSLFDRPVRATGLLTVDAPADPKAALNAVLDLIESVTDGGKPGASFTRTQLQEAYEAHRATVPILNRISGEVAGKFSRRDGTLAAYLLALKDAGVVMDDKNKGVFVVVDLARVRGTAPPAQPIGDVFIPVSNDDQASEQPEAA